MTLVQLRDTIDEYLKTHKDVEGYPIIISANSNNFEGEWKDQNFIRINNNEKYVYISIAVSKRHYDVFCNDGYNSSHYGLEKNFEG